MTRLGLFSTLVALPLASFGAARGSATEHRDEEFLTFSPGTISIAPGGGIRIVGAKSVSIERCTFHTSFLATDRSPS